MNMIHAEKLVYEYDKRDEEGNVIGTNRAIDGVDIDVPQGSFVAVLGHNGSGKSTLAKHMNAILIPTGGTVWVDGQDTKDPENLWDVRKSAGMVFQNPDNQIIGTVVEEDVGFGPENIGIPTDEIWERVGESLRLVGMTEYRASSPNKLSGGQKQRVAIAGVIAMEPKCIVLDEPTAMLDPNGRKEVLQAVARLRKEKNVTGILITHYMEEVEHIADRILVIDKGKQIAGGTLKELLQSYENRVIYFLELDGLHKNGLNEFDFLNNINGIQKVQIYKEMLKVTAQKNISLSELFSALSTHGYTIKNMSSETGSLETVFLELTGRNLRD